MRHLATRNTATDPLATDKKEDDQQECHVNHGCHIDRDTLGTAIVWNSHKTQRLV